MEKVPQENRFVIKLVKTGGVASAYKMTELSNKDSFEQTR